MTRKTIDVQTLKERANTRLAYEEYESDHWSRVTPQQAYREGVASLLSWVLMETGNYKGFGYVEPGGYPIGKFEEGVTDETRRCYY
jgi:hypothetical protein